MVERLLWEQDADGSNPPVPTRQKKPTLVVGFFVAFGEHRI